MAALGDPVPASERRPSSAELSFACIAICPKLLCKVDFSTFHAALKTCQCPIECRTHSLHFGMAHLFRIKADCLRLPSPFGTSQMCQVIAKICSFICKSADSLGHPHSEHLIREKPGWENAAFGSRKFKIKPM